MAFTKIFYSDLSVTQANPTTLNDYTKVASNAEALRERFLMGHWFNDAGVTGEDGYHRADYDDPLWLYARDTGDTTTKYACLWIDRSTSTDPKLRIKWASSDTVPTSETDGYIVSGKLSRDLDGRELIIDADGDTSMTADTDDQIDFKIGGSDVFALFNYAMRITQAVGDAEVFSVKSVPADLGGGTNSFCSMYAGAIVTISDDDSATLYDAINMHGLMFLSTSGTSNANNSGALITLNTTSSPSATVIATGGAKTIAALNTDVDGNDGVDGEITVSAIQNNIKIENRAGSTIRVAWFIIGYHT